MAEKQSVVDLKGVEGKMAADQRIGKKKCKPWEKPVLEDVSGKVMAQPYIRFT